MEKPTGIRDEMVTLRITVSELSQENARMRMAVDDALTALAIVMGRLEALKSPGFLPSRAFEASDHPKEGCTSERETGLPNLFVIEERQFREQAVRVLSDGTIEADTPDGRFRFEDLQHLEEVFDTRWPLCGSAQ